MLNLASLNPAQRQAVETTDGPVLILAGAGTGKTRVITFRVARLVQKGVEPGRILAVTFTNKAAREMQERVRQLLGRSAPSAPGEPPSRPTVCTFHSLCARILRRHIERLGYKRNFVIYSESDQLGAIKRILSHISDQGRQSRSPRRSGLVEPLPQRRGTGLGFCRPEHGGAGPARLRALRIGPARLQRGGF